MSKRLDIVEEKFLNTIKENNLIDKNDVIVVGVSGGPDSMTLLHLLNKYKKIFEIRIIVAHINHLIREDSTDDEQFVENYCKKNDIVFYKKRVKVEEIAKKEKKGTEEIGRIIRYNFFDEILEKEKANKIAIAHNMNDNAETMLLNLIRGAGLSGLEGIQPKRNEKYIRPLIYCKREEIENYCKINELNPRIDSTNKQNIYKRNIIRNELLPFLKELNPNIVETLSRTSIIARKNNEFIKEQVNIFYEKVAINDNNQIKINAKEFNKLADIIKEGIILKAIEELTGTIKNVEKSNVDDVIKLAKNNVGNKNIFFNKNIKASILKGILTIESLKKVIK